MLAEIGYNRAAAVAYADRWALSRNPRFFDFHGLGGDCTNFISQCLYAGCGIMNYTPTMGWFYISASNRAPAWTGVQYLYNFLTANRGPGPHAIHTEIERMRLGDVIQLGAIDGTFYHSLLVTRIEGAPSLDGIYVSTHTIDSHNRPLNTYVFSAMRCLHIAGARKYV